jgi:hypothetical protein
MSFLTDPTDPLYHAVRYALDQDDPYPDTPTTTTKEEPTMLDPIDFPDRKTDGPAATIRSVLLAILMLLGATVIGLLIADNMKVEAYESGPIIRDGVMRPSVETPTGPVLMVTPTYDSFDGIAEGVHVKLSAGTYTGFTVEPKKDQTWECLEGAVLDGQGHVPHAFHGNNDDVIIIGCEIHSYHPPSQNGAINARGGPRSNEKPEGVPLAGQGARWKVVGVNIHDIHNGAGIFLGHRGTLTHSRISDTAEQGIRASGGGGLTIHGNVIERTSLKAKGDHGLTHWNAGAMKLLTIRNSAITGNQVSDSVGAGIWCDIACDNVTITGNDIKDSGTSGIFYEISLNGVIEGNKVRRCGTGPSHRGWRWEAGIQVVASKGMVIGDNVVTGCDNGLSLISQPRGKSPVDGWEYRLDDVTVNSNRIDGWVGIAVGTTRHDPNFTDPDVDQRVHWAGREAAEAPVEYVPACSENPVEQATELGRFMEALRHQESRARYWVEGPTTRYGRATGAYQFLDSTWQGYAPRFGVEGFRSANDASEAQQDHVACSAFVELWHKWEGSWWLIAVEWHSGPGGAAKAARTGRATAWDAAAGIGTQTYADMVMERMETPLEEL